MRTDGRVVAAGCVAKERLRANRRVPAADRSRRRCWNREHQTDRRVIDARCKADESATALSRVVVGVASVRRWANGSRCWAKAQSRRTRGE